MSRYALLPLTPSQTTPYNIFVPLGAFPPDRRPYKQLTRCAKDVLYIKEKEDETMLYRPLFWTSYWFQDKLDMESYYGATNVLISSASSKTAFCLAYVIKQSQGRKIRTVGLTSPRNVKFTEGLGLYDTVLTYDALESTLGNDKKEEKWIYVDVAGASSLNSRIFDTLSSSLLRAISLGMTNVSETPSFSLSGPTSTSTNDSVKVQMGSFFMPEHLAHRRTQLSVKEITAMQKHAWEGLIRDSTGWVNIVRTGGGKGVLEGYGRTLEGGVGPDVGQVFSLWDTQARL